MDGSLLTSSQRQNLQTPARRVSAGGSHKDLWSVTRQGSLSEVDSALAFLKKIGGNVDLRNMFGLTPLHIATWRNHIPIVRRLLAAGVDPDARMENLDGVVYTELFTLAISLWRIFFSNLVLLLLWRTLKVEHLLISYLDLSRR